LDRFPEVRSIDQGANEEI